MRFMVKTYARVLEMQNFIPAYMKGCVDVRTDDFLRTKTSWMHSLQIILPMVLRWASFARESSAITLVGHSTSI